MPRPLAMKVLAIDTATEVLALSAANGAASGSLAFRNGLQHSPALAPLIERLLSQLALSAREIELIVCSIGPGSFTGIRIGLATAMGISFATGCPIVGISSLDTLASPHENHEGHVFPVIDARKGNFYTAVFHSGRRESEYLDLPPQELRVRLSEADRPLVSGPDAKKILKMLGDMTAPIRCSELFDPLALLQLGTAKYAREGADPDGLRPLYLRKSEAEIAGGL